MLAEAAVRLGMSPTPLRCCSTEGLWGPYLGGMDAVTG